MLSLLFKEAEGGGGGLAPNSWPWRGDSTARGGRGPREGGGGVSRFPPLSTPPGGQLQARILFCLRPPLPRLAPSRLYISPQSIYLQMAHLVGEGAPQGPRTHTQARGQEKDFPAAGDPRA